MKKQDLLRHLRLRRTGASASSCLYTQQQQLAWRSRLYCNWWWCSVRSSSKSKIALLLSAAVAPSWNRRLPAAPDAASTMTLTSLERPRAVRVGIDDGRPYWEPRSWANNKANTKFLHRSEERKKEKFPCPARSNEKPCITMNAVQHSQ